MSWYTRKLRDLLRRAIEQELAQKLVEHHWPAVEETLRAEFDGPCLDTALAAGKRALHRLVEHVV